MRSLSPSRTFTWTRTVSPGLIAGRFTMLLRSTVSTAVMSLSFESAAGRRGHGEGGCALFERATISRDFRVRAAIASAAPDRLDSALRCPASPDARRAYGPAPRAGAIAR